MQNIEFRNKQYLLWRKIISLVIGWVCLSPAFSQLRNGPNLADYDEKAWHGGIHLSFNKSHFLFTHHPYFLQRDTIMDVESVNNSGIGLAIYYTQKISNHFSFRTNLFDLTFSDKVFLYKESVAGDTSLTEKKVSSITIGYPILLKFSSDRINNFKVYTISGIKFTYDLNSAKGARNAEDLIKLKKGDVSVEVGLGFHFYFPVFVLTPEIKLSSGLVNLHSRDENLRYSNVIDKIKSKMITFSLTVE